MDGNDKLVIYTYRCISLQNLSCGIYIVHSLVASKTIKCNMHTRSNDSIIKSPKQGYTCIHVIQAMVVMHVVVLLSQNNKNIIVCVLQL